MKRPPTIYLVAGWCFLVFMAQLGKVEKGLKGLSGAQISPEIGHLASALAAILIIWHIVRLIQLKAFNRWFSMGVLALYTLELLWHLTFLVPKLEHSGRYAVGTLSVSLLNVACIWYLGRRAFRQFAVEFVAEREKEKHTRNMQEASKKKLQDEIRNKKS